MFTGIVQMVGKITHREIQAKQGILKIMPSQKLEDPILGESIAINGVCLTLTNVGSQGELTFDALAQTLRVTNLGELNIGSAVNMERAVRPIDRLGGHFVQGHVDTTGKILGLEKKDDDVVVTVELPEKLKNLIIPTGSITLDGISLTVVKVTSSTFTVHLIPTTLSDTALTHRKIGDALNLEGDIIGKYIQHMLGKAPNSNVTLDMLFKAGF